MFSGVRATELGTGEARLSCQRTLPPSPLVLSGGPTWRVNGMGRAGPPLAALKQWTRAGERALGHLGARHLSGP